MENRLSEIHLWLQDEEWPFSGVDHTRQIARGIVFDGSGDLYFVRVERDDEFGKATLIETAGGGVEEGEDLPSALLRELQEELGATARLVCKIGVVEDEYNLIHRRNVNHYFLCEALSFGERRLTPDEQQRFHLSVAKRTYEQAVEEYRAHTDTPLGRLIANRELPILHRAKALLDSLEK